MAAVNYRKEHPNLTQVECAKNLGIGVSTCGKWEVQFRNNDDNIHIKRLIEAIYTEVSVKAEAANIAKCRVSTYGMQKFFGVSHPGYRAFLNRKVSPPRHRKESVKMKIRKIYDHSKQNYGAPKITKELRKSGETIA